MYLNLFFKSVKADAAVAVTTADIEGAAGSEIATERGERVKALIRRFLQVLVSGGGGAPEFIAGGLYLLGEVGYNLILFYFFLQDLCLVVLVCPDFFFSSFSFLLIYVFAIIILCFVFRQILTCFPSLLFTQLFSSVPGLRSMINNPPKPPSSTQQGSSYDPRKREPRFAHASALPLWELVRTHPIVYLYHLKKPLNRRLSSHTTTPQYLCTRGNSSQACRSQLRLTSHRTRSRISSRGSCIRTLKNQRRRLLVSMAMATTTMRSW